MKKLAIILSFACLLGACGETDSTDLNKCWAQLEVSGDEETYTFCDDPELNATWFRQTYSFRKDGVCEYLVLSPVDVHFTEEGSYKLKNNNSLIEITDKNGDFMVNFEIVSLSEKQLVLKRQ